MGAAITGGNLPRIISVRNHQVQSVNAGWNEFTVTIADNQAMPDKNYTVQVIAREFTDPGWGGAHFSVYETVSVTATTFRVRINSDYSGALPCFLDYVCIQNTATMPNPAATYIGDTSWTYPVLLNSWVNYSAPGGYQGARFRKLITGQVEIQGLIRAGTAAHVFTLPVGYRPSGILLIRSMTDPDVIGRLDINPSGIIQAIRYSPGWLALQCTFYADQ